MKPERLDKKVTPMLKDGIERWGERVLDKLGSEVRFDLKNPIIDDYLDGWREQKIVGITDTARDRVTRTLQEGVDKGEGIDEIKRRLRREFEDMTAGKAEVIARTEVIGSSNAASLAAYQLSGLVDSKEWLSVQDTQTRETHADLDGQQRSIRDDFESPSGAKAQGPGLFGLPEEDINCRCTVIPVVNGTASPVGEARAVEWRSYIDGLGEYEKTVREGVAQTFAGWLGDVVSSLG